LFIQKGYDISISTISPKISLPSKVSLKVEGKKYYCDFIQKQISMLETENNQQEQ
jgi:sorbitol-specific phosphotransferase system component IIBC